MKSLRERAEETCKEVLGILDGTGGGGNSKKIAGAIEKAIINALLEERHRCANVALKCCSEDEDKAHKIDEEIRRVNTALIANLSSMR
jgi:hypothetical protein